MAHRSTCLRNIAYPLRGSTVLAASGHSYARLPLQSLRLYHIPSESPQSFPRIPWENKDADAAVTDTTTLAHQRVLSRMPTADLLRGLVLNSAMSKPALMDMATELIRKNVKTLTGNALTHYVLDKMFYAQFCAGRTEAEIRRTLDGLVKMGYKGAILSYAKEVDLSGAKYEPGNPLSESQHQDWVAQWLEGTLKTIEYGSGFVAVKYTGAGLGCVHALEAGQKPDIIMVDALEKICQAAKDRGVKLLFDAEHYAQKEGIDSWTMDLMEKYNREETVVYNTYQMYLKESSATLAAHLQRAKTRGFNLGVKLVRGAYINTDPRHLIHDTKEDTDRAFDKAALMLASQHIDNPSAPKVGLVLASHNKESTENMRELRKEQIRNGLPLADVVYSQLFGMADELSLSLTQDKPDLDEENRVFKYVVWGTTEECMMYLLRRAEENRDAVERSTLSQQALWEEFRGRISA